MIFRLKVVHLRDAESTNDAADANFVAAIESGDPLINVPENQLSIQLSKGLTFADMPVRIGQGCCMLMSV